MGRVCYGPRCPGTCIVEGCKFVGVVNSWMLLICIRFMRQVTSLGVYLSIICPSKQVLFYYKSKCLESK